MTEAELLKAIDELGPDAHAIATSLRDRGIRGRRRESCDCPLARFLSGLAGQSISVDGEAFRIFDGSNRHPRVLLTDVAGTFVREFDEGRYPYLVDRSFR